MSKLIALTILLTLGLCLQSLCAVDKTLMGVWLFDEGNGDTVKDSSPNKNDGKITNCKWVNGKFGKALEFNGKDTGVEIPDSDSLAVSDDKISITAWFTQTPGAAEWATVVCKGQYKAGFNENWAVFTNTNLKYICTTLTLQGGERWWTISGNDTVAIEDKWRHFASTYDGKTLTYYLDGKLVITYPKTGKLLPCKENLTIGCRSNDGIRWSGALDEIGVFNRVLSEDEIKSIMSSGYAGFLAVEPIGKLPVTWGDLKK